MPAQFLPYRNTQVTTPISTIGTPYSATVTVGTSSVVLVPGLPPGCEDYTEVWISNNSTGGQVLTINITGQPATAGAGIIIPPGISYWASVDSVFIVTRVGITGICNASGGSIGVTYR